VKTPRQIAIADHLWEAFGRMAEEMGSDRDALVNHAMHAFARQNGYGVSPPPEVVPPPPPAGPAAPRAAVAERVLETAARLERALEEETPARSARRATLVIVREDGTAVPVDAERFLIGRGRHCHLVVDSSKVSREHAVIVRDGEGWTIEDLGSANGTWHQRDRIGRHAIADGDEIFICSEKIRCVLR
jgi:hypothetical protein